MTFKYPSKKIVALIAVVYLLIVTHILLQAGMSCVDSKGCLKSWCSQDYFNDEYKKLIAVQQC